MADTIPRLARARARMVKSATRAGTTSRLTYRLTGPSQRTAAGNRTSGLQARERGAKPMKIRKWPGNIQVRKQPGE